MALGADAVLRDPRSAQPPVPVTWPQCEHPWGRPVTQVSGSGVWDREASAVRVAAGTVRPLFLSAARGGLVRGAVVTPSLQRREMCVRSGGLTQWHLQPRKWVCCVPGVGRWGRRLEGISRFRTMTCNFTCLGGGYLDGVRC